MADTKRSDRKSLNRRSKKKRKEKAAREREEKSDDKQRGAVQDARPRATTMAATEVAPNLYVGTREDAEALGESVPDGWACVSVTEFRSRYRREEELPLEPVGSLDLPFMVDAPGGWHADPHKLDLIAETIWWRIRAGKKVLVHCIHAQERAPLAVAWYLAWSGDAPSVQSAYDVVARRHPRTERRDAWLRGVGPASRASDLLALLTAARPAEPSSNGTGAVASPQDDEDPASQPAQRP